MPAKLPSLALSGDDLSGAAAPGVSPWAQGPATPVTPPAAILPDPNVMWLDPGMLMEPGTGFGAAQKLDALGQAIDDAQQFLDGGRGGGGRSQGPGALQQIGDAVAQGKKIVQQFDKPDAFSGLSPAQYQAGAGAYGAPTPWERANMTPGEVDLAMDALADPSNLLGRPSPIPGHPDLYTMPGGMADTAGEVGRAVASPSGGIAYGDPQLGGLVDTAAGSGAGTAASGISHAISTALEYLPYVGAVAALAQGIPAIVSDDITGRQRTAATINTIGQAAAPFTFGVSAPIGMILADIIGQDKSLEARGQRFRQSGELAEALGRQLEGVTPATLEDVLKRQVYLNPYSFGTPDYAAGVVHVPEMTYDAGEGGLSTQAARDLPMRGFGTVGSFLREIMQDPRVGGEYSYLAPLLEGYGPTKLTDRYGWGRIGSVGEMLRYSGGDVRNPTVGPMWAQLLSALEGLAASRAFSAAQADLAAKARAQAELARLSGTPMSGFQFGGGSAEDELPWAALAALAAERGY